MSVYPIVIEIQILLTQRARQIPEPKKIHRYLLTVFDFEISGCLNATENPEEEI